MRIEITHSRAVHTSKGRRLAPERVDLPDGEAERIIENGHGKKVRGRRPKPTEPPPAPLEVDLPALEEETGIDVGSGEPGGVSEEEQLA